MNDKMKNAKFDPKLKEMMDELDPIFKKYDVMGFVNVTSRTHGEFRIFFPPWSTAQWEKDSVGRSALRFKSKKGEQTHRDTEDTVFGLMSIRDMAGELFMMMEKMSSELDKHMEIDHTMMPITPHGED